MLRIGDFECSKGSFGSKKISSRIIGVYRATRGKEMAYFATVQP